MAKPSTEGPALTALVGEHIVAVTQTIPQESLQLQLALEKFCGKLLMAMIGDCLGILAALQLKSYQTVHLCIKCR